MHRADLTPGQQGYLADEAAMLDGSYDFQRIQVLSRTVLVSLDHAPAGIPEGGTVFRLTTSPGPHLPAPVRSAPTDFSQLPRDAATFGWQALARAHFHHLQVAADAGFSTLVVDQDSLGQPYYHAVGLPPQQQLYWRVRSYTTSGFLSDWSSTGRINTGQPTRLSTRSDELPETTALNPNYPNPFNPLTTIQFGLARAEQVRLTIYDAMGREVEQLWEGALPAGWHQVTWNASRLASGVYLSRLTTGTATLARTLILLK